MKKILIGLCLGFILVAGCTQAEDSGGKDKHSKTDVAGLLNEIAEANNDFDSLSMNMKMNQDMTTEDSTYEANSELNMDIIMEPFQAKQQMNAELSDVDQQEMEFYLLDNAFYVLDPQADQWIKLSAEDATQIIPNIDEYQQQIGGQMNQFIEFAEDIKVEETDNEYIFTLKAEGDKFNEMLSETIKDALPEAASSTLDSLDMHTANYEITVEKDTLYLSKLFVSMEYDIEIEGQHVTIKQNVASTYSNHNQIDDIVVPEEVLEKAVEM